LRDCDFRVLLDFEDTLLRVFLDNIEGDCWCGGAIVGSSRQFAPDVVARFKGVRNSRGTKLWFCHGLCKCVDASMLSPGQEYLMMLPVFHVRANSDGLMGAHFRMYSGSCIIVIIESFFKSILTLTRGQQYIPPVEGQEVLKAVEIRISEDCR
jgi:hypothetical protein